MIQIINLSKSYGEETVLKDINIELIPNMIYGLVGENGSGKTTFMRCICGFSKPTSGMVIVNEKRIGKDVDFAPDMGIIIEEPGFLPHYSGLKNLLMLSRISGRADKDRCKSVMKLVRLNPQDRKPVNKYSLGMRQRLGIAQAILENPDILVLDEPFNGLDPSGIKEIHLLLQQLKHEGKLILLASHSMEDIRKACDLVYKIADGNIHLMEDFRDMKEV